MSRPIVHIGYHKTATTWFQKSFYPHVRNFAYVDRLKVKRAFLRDTPFAFDPERARAVLELPADEPPILCEEELSGYLHNGGLGGHLSAEVARRIKAVLPDARIVIFVRSQPSMIAATYQQYIRGGGTRSVGRYLFAERHLRGAAAEPYKIPRFSFAHFDYDRLVAHYDGIFGREDVLVVPYEEFSRRPEATIATMAERLGMDVELGGKADKAVNRSYGAALIPLARAMNLFTARTVLDKRVLLDVPGWYGVRRFILERLNATGAFGRPPSPERLLGRDVVRHIEERYAPSNRRLMALRDLPLGELGYPV